jgi:hypothetical protein
VHRAIDRRCAPFEFLPVYSTCTFCHASLGRNEALERFPVGRRVAIDQARGRLWAVCYVCGQWNLSPLETRWEAIEEGEKLYRDARLRVSTDQIGLARLKDGTELVRVGEPLRPEFAAWRYGERFAKRWRITGRVTAAYAGVMALGKYAGAFTSLVGFAPVAAILGVDIGVEARTRFSTAAWIRLPSGRRARVTHAHAQHMLVTKDPELPGGWRLEVPHEPVAAPWRFARFRDPFTTFTGDSAREVAAQLLPRLNRGGGRKQDVERAVGLLDSFGSPDAIMRLAAEHSHPRERADALDTGPSPEDTLRLVNFGKGPFAAAPAEIRLAVEMAVHEDAERRAMQGELAQLAQRWKDAEEVAAIADDLVVAPMLLRAMERLRLR